MSTVLEGLDKGLVAVLAARDVLLALRQEETAECGDHEDHVLDRETYVRLRGYVQEVARQQFRLEETARARDPAVREIRQHCKVRRCRTEAGDQRGRHSGPCRETL